MCHAPTIGLVIVGDGSERKRLEGVANTLDVADRVYFAGQASQAETIRLMAACDFFVLNSTHEGLPHVVLEAMSLGLPVVATAVGGTPEVVCDGEQWAINRASGRRRARAGVVATCVFSGGTAASG